jgi:hypothetical protein
MSRKPIVLLAALCAALLPSAALADGPPATVSGNGEATVHVVPTKLRVQVQIVGQGKTSEQALERLKARREAVAETLRGLGAQQESVAFGDPCVSQQIQQMNACTPYGCPPCYTAPPVYAVPPPAGPPPLPGPAAPPTIGPPGGGPVTPPRLPPGVRGPLPPATIAPPSGVAVPVELPSSGVRGDSSSPGPSGTHPPAAAAVPQAYSPTTSSTPAYPPSAYQLGAPPGTSTAPTYLPPGASAAPPTASAPNASAPSFPAYGYTVPPPAYAPSPVPAPTIAVSYVATGTLTSEWSLEANTAEQALLAGEAIRKKVLAADLVGDKAPEKAPAGEPEPPYATLGGAHPQSQTAVARTPAAPYAPVTCDPFFGRTAVPAVATPSPTFVYVATISSQQRKAALAEAFQKAKSQAAEMAEAAGGKIGAVATVNGGVSNFSTTGGFGACAVMPPAPTPSDNNVMLRGDPNHCDFQARVYAQFRLE